MNVAHSPQRIRACVLGLCSIFAATALAAAGPARAAGSDLDPKTMVLAASDLGPGAKVAQQQLLKPSSPITASYVRVFSGARVGSQPLLVVESSVLLFADADTATGTYAELNRELRTPSGKRLFGTGIAQGFTQSAKGALKLTAVAVSAPSALGVGQSALRFSVTATIKPSKTSAKPFTLSFQIGILRVDRSIAVVAVVPPPTKKLAPTALVRVAQAQATRFESAFTVATVSPPAVTGTAAQAQTLTASAGEWRGAPSAFAYQWSRCDATGVTCTSIAGATGAAYTVAPEDLGSVVRVSVTASNSVTSLAATSAPTALVG